MKRNNIVFLVGQLIEFRKENLYNVEIGCGVVATDFKALGGHHTVYITDPKMIKEVETALSVHNPIEVAVVGYLAGGNVMAERITFLLSNSERERLKDLLTKRL